MIFMEASWENLLVGQQLEGLATVLFKIRDYSEEDVLVVWSGIPHLLERSDFYQYGNPELKVIYEW